MRKTIWDKRIPTLLGLILIIIGVGITSFLVKNGIISVGHAGPTQTPQSIKITNISDSSFTVSYATEDNVFGSVNYGASQTFGQTALDDRDSLSKAVVPHKLHAISMNNLDSATTYYFSITSAEGKYLNNGEPFSVTTASSIAASPSAQKPVSGKVLLSDGSAPAEAIVYLFSDDSQVVSALVRNDGGYLIPLNSLRIKGLNKYFEFNEKTNLKLIVVSSSATSNVILSINQINPVPTITLSNNYDFTSSTIPISSQSAKIASSSGFPSIDSGSSSSGFNPTILTPSKDEGFSDSQPVFKGKALPNQSVDITIQSDSQIKQTITTDASGNWQFRPTTALSAGQHTISIQTKDSSGIVKTITQSFTVYAAGTQISGPATTSTTPTPTPTISLPSPTLNPTPTPTISPTPSPTPIVLLISPSPSKTPLPPTGNPNILGIGVLGAGIAVIGGLIFILTRGQIPL